MWNIKGAEMESDCSLVYPHLSSLSLIYLVAIFTHFEHFMLKTTLQSKLSSLRDALNRSLLGRIYVVRGTQSVESHFESLTN